jgi:nucleoside-diphosphate-sugar epimerase
MDRHVLKLFKAIRCGKFRLIGDGSSLLHPTYVDDAVHCMVKSLDEKVRNHAFLVAGERAVSVKELALIIQGLVDGVPSRPVPYWVAWSYVKLTSMPASVLGIDPILTGTRLAWFTRSRSFDTGKAKSILGLKQVALEKGLSETTSWYDERGLL